MNERNYNNYSGETIDFHQEKSSPYHFFFSILISIFLSFIISLFLISANNRILSNYLGQEIENWNIDLKKTLNSKEESAKSNKYFSNNFKLLSYPEQKVDANWIENHVVQLTVRKELTSWMNSFKRLPRYQTKLFNNTDNHILMYGPPGSGKSFIAELFARNESCAYAFVKFETKIYVGSSLAAQEKVLKQAKIILENEKKESEKSSREKRPVVIIMDEIDSIGVKDKTGDHQYMNHQTNGILRMIDEIRRDKLDIILIGITNYPETLDDALIRTGRLGRKICVPHFQEEDVNSLEDIFKKEVKEINWKFFESNSANNKIIWKEDDNEEDVVVWVENFWSDFREICRNVIAKYNGDIGVAYTDLCYSIEKCISEAKIENHKITPSPYDFEIILTRFMEEKNNKFNSNSNKVNNKIHSSSTLPLFFSTIYEESTRDLHYGKKR